MSEEIDPELRKRWDAILAKRGLAVVIATLAACPRGVVGAGQGSDYLLHQPGLKRNPSRAYVEGWVTRQQAAADQVQTDCHQEALGLDWHMLRIAAISAMIGAALTMIVVVALLK
jgi:hypothetical protein